MSAQPNKRRPHPLTVLDLVADGRLPVRLPDRLRGQVGTGSPCAICGNPIAAGAAAFELEFVEPAKHASPATFRVHDACHAVWDAELRRAARRAGS